MNSLVSQFLLISSLILISDAFLSQIKQTKRHIEKYSRYMSQKLEKEDLNPLQIEDDRRKLLLNRFREAWTLCLQGNLENLKELMPNGINWRNPLVSGPDIKEGFSQFANFFQEPVLIFFDEKKLSGKNAYEIEYQLSFWYPMPWKPRIIIPGKAIVAISQNQMYIDSVLEEWDITIWDIFLKQFPPRFWDFWHAFSSPTPEYPPFKLIGSAGKVDFIMTSPTIAAEILWSAPSK